MRGSTTPEVDRIKQGARWLWSQGDYSQLARLLEAPAIDPAARCVSPGLRVLDVAAGNGNFALAAARRGGVVTATDLSPRMVELGRARSAAEAFSIEWGEADAESLPFPDAGFDVVASVFGAMFAPRPTVIAAEMFRTVRPGGTVAMANYRPEGYLMRLSDLMGGFSTQPAPELPSPFAWGDPAEVRRRLEPFAADLQLEARVLHFEFESFSDCQARFAGVNPPLMGMKALLPAAAYDGLIQDSWSLAQELNVGTGAVVLESGYLAVLATSPRGSPPRRRARAARGPRATDCRRSGSRQPS